MTPKVNHPILLMPQEAKININLFAWSHLNLIFNLNFYLFFFCFVKTLIIKGVFIRLQTKFWWTLKKCSFNSFPTTLTCLIKSALYFQEVKAKQTSWARFNLPKKLTQKLYQSWQKMNCFLKWPALKRFNKSQ